MNKSSCNFPYFPLSIGKVYRKSKRVFQRNTDGVDNFVVVENTTTLISSYLSEVNLLTFQNKIQGSRLILNIQCTLCTSPSLRLVLQIINTFYILTSTSHLKNLSLKYSSQDLRMRLADSCLIQLLISGKLGQPIYSRNHSWLDGSYLSFIR